jgi:GTP cyclohydrolase II
VLHRFDAGECITVSYGDVADGTPIVRIHSSCLFGESFHALDCDCSKQLSSALEIIAAHGCGVVVYRYCEGRGVGLENKMKALALQHNENIDTVEAFARLGFTPDERDYSLDLLALQELGICKTVKFASQNPNKHAAMERGGYKIVETVHPEIELTEFNRSELYTKKHKLGYKIQTV